jgi:hypothetical protein
MFRNAILAAAAVAVVGTTLLVFQAGPANAACHRVGYANGEPTCLVTSDGEGQPYTDGRSWVTRHMDQVRERRFLGQQKIKRINHQGANW